MSHPDAGTEVAGVLLGDVIAATLGSNDHRSFRRGTLRWIRHERCAFAGREDTCSIRSGLRANLGNWSSSLVSRLSVALGGGKNLGVFMREIMRSLRKVSEHPRSG